MLDDVYKEFFRDTQTQRVLDSSEVWQNYSRAELARDVIRQKNALEEKLDTENAILDEIQEFRDKVASNPALKAQLQKAAAALRAHPELVAKVDPNFLKGLSLLDLED